LAEKSGMGGKLLAAVIVGWCISSSVSTACAQSMGQAPSILVSIGNDAADGRPNRTEAHPAHIAPSKKPASRPRQGLDLRALDPKIEIAKGKLRNVDSIALEPWAPGRGSLGVKVEVTW
jgi:hypothetical protein